VKNEKNIQVLRRRV